MNFLKFIWEFVKDKIKFVEFCVSLNKAKNINQKNNKKDKSPSVIF